ncbi:endo-1,3-alpha-glucanase family glycosylhydrolase [Arcticibacter eurypsychrophilus]|uniref:endo-1,3-alpha-glucanase family glycosylhydrolase n=1 Tax=Arcticibacter eurypsychrophilus TaxID=1434752 RepID=UPI00147F5762|nr:endo-1,3-alpha-glucanase family glycosylhydrolase [Arcticibacter eurypsychrophilus]
MSLPITSEKLVIAHCMTNIIRYKGHPLEDSSNPDYYKSTGNSSAPLGGLTQVKVMVDSLMANASLDESVEFEMRAALRSGIDGFQFYYTLGGTNDDAIILAYFRVAQKKNIKFKFTFCISHPKGKTEALKIGEFAFRMNHILDVAGRSNPHWLRTPDGRLIIYLWDGESLADIPSGEKRLPDQFYMARAYKRLADAVHERFACVFTINKQISKKELNYFLDYFPATWVWTLPFSGKNYIGYMIAAECKRRQRTFTASVFNDFYTSKLLKKGTWDMYHHVEDAVQAGIENVERKYITTGLSYNFRKLMEFGIEQDASLFNMITWNDYPEGHHLAPEVNHNEGFSILLNYYKSLWKGMASPYENRDVAIVFFKKYNHLIQPKPFNIPVVPFQQEVIPAEWEDSIEVLTLLKGPAEISLNGQLKKGKSGLSVFRFPMKTGNVKVSVLRDHHSVLQFLTPEGITDKPYRSDRITYTYSSEFKTFYMDLYKGFKPLYSSEYNLDFYEENK